MTSVTVLVLAVRSGAAWTVTFVGSAGAGVEGSSVGVGWASPWAKMAPWLAMTVPSSRGLTTWELKERTTWLPGATLAREFYTGGPVLEVLAFSANMPDPMTGSFAAEIKMGYLHKDGQRIPVAQGSVTGNVFEALANCRLSRETEEDKGYFGPAQVRFEDMQVAGA